MANGLQFKGVLELTGDSTPSADQRRQFRNIAALVCILAARGKHPEGMPIGPLDFLRAFVGNDLPDRLLREASRGFDPESKRLKRIVADLSVLADSCDLVDGNLTNDYTPEGLHLSTATELAISYCVPSETVVQLFGATDPEFIDIALDARSVPYMDAANGFITGLPVGLDTTPLQHAQFAPLQGCLVSRDLALTALVALAHAPHDAEFAKDCAALMYYAVTGTTSLASRIALGAINAASVGDTVHVGANVMSAPVMAFPVFFSDTNEEARDFFASLTKDKTNDLVSAARSFIESSTHYPTIARKVIARIEERVYDSAVDLSNVTSHSSAVDPSDLQSRMDAQYRDKYL